MGEWLVVLYGVGIVVAAFFMGRETVRKAEPTHGLGILGFTAAATCFAAFGVERMAEAPILLWWAIGGAVVGAAFEAGMWVERARQRRLRIVREAAAPTDDLGTDPARGDMAPDA